MLVTSFAANWRWSLLATTYWILAQHLRCVSPLADVCHEESPTSSCGDPEIRYYYDGHTRSCRTFHWRGCPSLGGFGNIFENAQECVEACNGTVVESDESTSSSTSYTVPTPRSGPPGETPPISPLPPDPVIATVTTDTGADGFKLEHCLLPLDTGVSYPGFPPYPLYFFNSSSRQCELFYLLGEGGNHNNFFSIEDCLDKCGELSDPFSGDMGSGDTPSDDTPTTSDDTLTTRPVTESTTSPTTRCPTLPHSLTGRPPVAPGEPCITPSEGTATTSSASLTLPSELPVVNGGTEDNVSVVTQDPSTLATTTTERIDTETNGVATTEQVVVVEGDKDSVFFLYAAAAVTVAVAVLSLAAVGVVILMMYRYQRSKRLDAEIVGHREQVRKALPSTSTCSSSVSV